MEKLGQLKNLTCLTMSFSSNASGVNRLEKLAKLDKLEVLNLGIRHPLNRPDTFELYDWAQSRTRSLHIMERVFQKLKKLKNVKIVLPRLNGLDLSHNEKWTNQVTKDLVQRLRMKYPGLTLKVYKEQGIGAFFAFLIEFNQIHK